MLKKKKTETVILCEGCMMDTGDEVFADWVVYWRDSDLKEDILSLAICNDCYELWKVQFAHDHQRFRSRRIKRKRTFIFR